MSCLHALVAVAAALNNADADGRILLDAHAQSIRFVLLNAATHFVKASGLRWLDSTGHCMAACALPRSKRPARMRGPALTKALSGALVMLAEVAQDEHTGTAPAGTQRYASRGSVLHACPGMQVLSPAHAVVLASGTLAPVASLQQQLFPGLAPARLHHFSCGHVVRARSPPLDSTQGPYVPGPLCLLCCLETPVTGRPRPTHAPVHEACGTEHAGQERR